MTLRMGWDDRVIRAFVELALPEGEEEIRWVTGPAIALEAGCGEAKAAITLKALAASGLAEKAKVPEVDYQLGYRPSEALIKTTRAGATPDGPMWDAGLPPGERLGGGKTPSVLDAAVTCVCGIDVFDVCSGCGRTRNVLVRARKEAGLPLYGGGERTPEALYRWAQDMIAARVRTELPARSTLPELEVSTDEEGA